MAKSFERREEAAQFIYVDGVAEFMVKGNGQLHWFRIKQADQQDLEEIFNAKKA